CGGFYSNGYEAPVPEVLTVSVAYHLYFVTASVVLPVRCTVCLLPLGKVDLAPPYLCQVNRTTVDPPMPV
ncbi:hypothetical protein B296_00058345, partial [Ensete ventricosum]